MNLYANAEANTRKTWIYLAGFFVFVIALGWLVSVIFQNSAILYMAVVFSVAMSFGSYWYSDKVALAMSGAKPATKNEYPELFRVVENLAITSGLPLPKIFVVQDRQPNAFATGRNASHAVVAATTGLLERLDRVELEGVIAHELSHIGNKDMLLSSIVVVLAGFVAILSNFFVRMTFFGGMRSRDDRQNNGNAQAFLMVVGIVFLILAPIAAKMIQFAISRKREFLADASGALLTRYPEGLARALEKIASDPNQLRNANPATAHLYIASPFKGKEQTNWFLKLFMTHPPIEERIKALRQISI